MNEKALHQRDKETEKKKRKKEHVDTLLTKKREQEAENKG